MSAEAFLNTTRERLESRLNELLGPSQSEYAEAAKQLAPLQQACRYAINVGGKRVRPALVYAAAQAAGGDIEQASLDRVAASVEFIHTYSLVHDDLPAMDDDDLRRGHPTVHRQFDEATAILVGDALQARALELLTEVAEISELARLKMVAHLCAACGPRGMAGGQAIDTAAVQQNISLGQLEAMHQLKTGALIRASVTLGGLWADAPPEQLHALDQYAKNIGLAFQVKDDLLDVEGETTTLGKTGGKDARNGKPTYVSLLGLKPARDKLRCLQEGALQSLERFNSEADALRELATYIINRDR